MSSTADLPTKHRNSELRRFVVTVRRAELDALRPRVRGRISVWLNWIGLREQGPALFKSPAFWPVRAFLRVLGKLAAPALRMMHSVRRGLAGLLSRVSIRAFSAIERQLMARRRAMRSLARLVVRPDGDMNYVGNNLLALSRRLIAWRVPIVSGAARRIVEAALLTWLSTQMAAGNIGNSITLARTFNVAFRPSVRARRFPRALLYFQALFHGRQYQRIVREFPVKETIGIHHLNHIVGISHLYSGDYQLAEYFLRNAIRYHDRYFLDFRMLGRTYLLLGNMGLAKKNFKKSIDLAPNTVMAHQNYAGRYDIARYRPKEWEVSGGGGVS